MRVRSDEEGLETSNLAKRIAVVPWAGVPRSGGGRGGHPSLPVVVSHPICPMATCTAEMSITSAGKTPNHPSEVQQLLMCCLIICRARDGRGSLCFFLRDSWRHRDAGETCWVTQPREEGVTCLSLASTKLCCRTDKLLSGLMTPPCWGLGLKCCGKFSFGGNSSCLRKSGFV